MSTPITKPRDFRIGGLDNSGEKVERIYYQNRAYVIYRTDRAIYVEVDDDSADVPKIRAANARLHGQLSHAYSLLPANLKWCEPFNKQIARAVDANISGQAEAAAAILSEAEGRIRRTKLIGGRLEFTISALVVCGVAVGFDWCAWMFSDVSESQVYMQYGDIAACGALGGFLSVVLSFRNLEIDLDASWLVNCLIGTSRIVIAMIGAVFAFFVVKSGLAFEPLNAADSSYAMFAIAMVAGFSERLVPSIMDNLSGDTKGDGRNLTNQGVRDNQVVKSEKPISGTARASERIVATNTSPPENTPQQGILPPQ